MDTIEILSKLAYLEKLEREFKEAHSNLSPSDIFDFYKKNNWPIVTELQTPLGVLTVLDEIGTIITEINPKLPMSVAQTDRNFQDYNDLLSLRKELSEKTGKSVDVVIEKFANPIILYRASKESIRVE
ncbi:hypothetical protein [Fibrobacter sp. UWH4]|uniref:hypothetical protein n=1 Tax=Fibrobacter sp. UWH4 TaxID=1896210 RepID=UPI0009124AC4|nr:hypothetical protein [Fibrobacter sp. UWH4]SHK89050.1 hypothetical protein SAMN05720762_103321 [Fibrobacter sp. UWH4]